MLFFVFFLFVFLFSVIFIIILMAHSNQAMSLCISISTVRVEKWKYKKKEKTKWNKMNWRYNGTKWAAIRRYVRYRANFFFFYSPFACLLFDFMYTVRLSVILHAITYTNTDNNFLLLFVQCVQFHQSVCLWIWVMSISTSIRNAKKVICPVDNVHQEIK